MKLTKVIAVVLLALAPATLVGGCTLAQMAQSDEHPMLKAGNLLAYVGSVLADIDGLYKASYDAGRITLVEYEAWKASSADYKTYWIGAKTALFLGDTLNLNAVVNSLRVELSNALVRSGAPIEQVLVVTLVLNDVARVPLPQVTSPVPEDQKARWEQIKAELNAIEARLAG